MAMSLGIGIGLPFGGGAAAAVAGTSATVFGTTPDVHVHPHSQSGTVTKSGDRIVGCPNLGSFGEALSGYAADGTTVAGPYELTDALGRKFWRFTGTDYVKLSAALNNMASRGFMALMVGRSHHQKGSCQFINPRFASYTSDGVNAQANSSIRWLRQLVTSSGGAFLSGCAPVAMTNTTDCYKVVCGAQLQVMAVASRTTVNGGQRYYINNDKCDLTQATSSVTGYSGLVIGGSAGASNTANITTSADNTFDLYEAAFWRSEVTNTPADAAVAASVSNFAIAQLDTNLVLEGDSITYGVSTALPTNPSPAGGTGSILSAPGAGYLPGNVRVINHATSGDEVAQLTVRRDVALTSTTASMFEYGKYPGGASKNVVAVQIGANDIGSVTGAVLYANVVALLNTAVSGAVGGYLQKGWRVVQCGNIATANPTSQGRLEDFRALIAASPNVATAGFKTDTLTNTGDAYDGLLSVLSLYEIQVASDYKFKAAADANYLTNALYNSDNLHLVSEGYQVCVTGGDDAAYGYGSIL